jgi:hypothetical protein
MATSIYEIHTVELPGSKVLEITPLKIKYMRQFMEQFGKIKYCKNDVESIDVLSECARITMQQYCPEIFDKDLFEDSVDIDAVYAIIDYSAGIKIKKDSEEEVKDQAEQKEGTKWEDFELAKLESEVFLLGIWKDFNHLEVSLSIPELTAILNAKRELDYDEKKFLAALQGVDLDKNSGRGQDEWEKMKARVFSGGAAKDSKDVLALQGMNAQMAGFGIGMGLGYEKIERKPKS